MQRASAATGCAHCGLSLGTWPYHREVDGVGRGFCCYGCFIGWEVGRGGGEESTAATLLVRLGVGAFLAMNIMLFSLAIYSQGPNGFNPGVQTLLHYVLLVFATPVILVLGGPYIAEAWSDISRAKLGASCLIATGALAAYLYSLIVTLYGGGRVYFDTATMVLCLFTLGRYLEANGRARAMRNLAPMLSPESATVCVVAAAGAAEKALGEVEAGDIVSIQPGDRILVDGTIVSGRCFVDESWLTGESQAIAKETGSRVRAGTINLDGVIAVEAEQHGLATSWVKICREMHHSLTQPTALQNVTDRLATRFVPIVFAISFLTVWYWSQYVAFDLALMNGLSVLVVACPCALGLAVPLATALSMEKLGKSGCLIRSGDVLYKLADVTHMAVDKTGTLTLGRMQVVRVVSYQSVAEQIISRAASIEAGSRHPVARGIIACSEQQGIDFRSANDIRTIPGQGISGLVDGEQVVVGTEQLFSDRQWSFPESRADDRQNAGENEHTLIYVGWQGQVQGAILMKDTIRSSARPAISALLDMGITTSVLSGDAEEPVVHVSRTLEIPDWRSGLSPEDKAVAVSRMRDSKETVAMVGDGINDGLAMLEADIGIAVHSGIDLAREAADVILPDTGLSNLPDIIRIAKHTRKTVRANLGWALLYNAVAIGLAAMGQLRPEFAAALMAGSSLMVIANSVRSNHGGEGQDIRELPHPDLHPVVDTGR